jgi:hypothetical protein
MKLGVQATNAAVPHRYSNETELKQLAGAHPFLLLRFKPA